MAVTDLRRGVMMRSEDQEEELISSTYIGGLPASGSSRGEKIIIGGSSGVLTLWEKGAWDDQDERIYVERGGAEGGETLETISVVPDDLGKGKTIAVGVGTGMIKFVRIGSNKVVSSVMHDETEGVVGLGFDAEGRMVSGGGQVVKVWHEALDGEDSGDVELGSKRMMGSDNEGSDDDSDDGSDRESRSGDKSRRKRKKAKGKDRTGGQHIMAFHDLD